MSIDNETNSSEVDISEFFKDLNELAKKYSIYAKLCLSGLLLVFS